MTRANQQAPTPSPTRFLLGIGSPDRPGPPRHPIRAVRVLTPEERRYDWEVEVEALMHQDAYGPAVTKAARQQARRRKEPPPQRRVPTADNPLRWVRTRMSRAEFEALPVCTYRWDGLRLKDVARTDGAEIEDTPTVRLAAERYDDEAEAEAEYAEAVDEEEEEESA